MTDDALAVLRLPPDAAAASVGDRRDPWSCWVRGVVAVARGDFGLAFQELEPVASVQRGAAAGEVAGLAAARMASAMRQLDEHAAAETWDRRACDSQGQAVVDGWIGRAADRVGLGEAELASRFLDRAAELAGCWRDAVRLGWVRTEISLLIGDVTAAQHHAIRSLAAAQAAAAPRHVVKSRLFLGAVRRRTQPPKALAMLRHALADAEAMQLRPLVWPVVIVLGDEATPAERAVGGAAAGYVAAHLPDTYGRRWRKREEIRALIAAGDRVEGPGPGST